MASLFRSLVVALSATLVLAGCITTNGGSRENFAALPPEVASTRSERDVAAILARNSRNPSWTARAVRIAERLNASREWTGEFHKQETKWRVIAVNSRITNFQSFPGDIAKTGYHIILHGGLFSGANLGDAELAGVIGHAMVHEMLDDTRFAADSEATAEKPTLTASVRKGTASPEQKAALQSAAAGKLATVSYTEKMEIAADRHAMLLMAGAGYHPRAYITAWEKLGKSAEAMKTHPLSTRRWAEMRKNLQNAISTYDKAARLTAKPQQRQTRPVQRASQKPGAAAKPAPGAVAKPESAPAAVPAAKPQQGGTIDWGL